MYWRVLPTYYKCTYGIDKPRNCKYDYITNGGIIIIKFILSDRKIKFLKHKVTWQDLDREFYTTEQKDNLVAHLDEREIEYTVTDYEQPTQEILDSVEGKTFNTIAEAQMFLDGTLPKSDKERINDLELLVLQLGGVI